MRTVANVASIVGGTALNNGKMFVELKPRGERPALQKVLADLRRDTARIAGIRAVAVPVQNLKIGGRSSRAEYQFVVQGLDRPQLYEWSQKMADVMSGDPLFRRRQQRPAGQRDAGHSHRGQGQGQLARNFGGAVALDSLFRVRQPDRVDNLRNRRQLCRSDRRSSTKRPTGSTAELPQFPLAINLHGFAPEPAHSPLRNAHAGRFESQTGILPTARQIEDTIHEDCRAEITIFRKANGPLTKRIALEADGSVKSDGSACVMAHGAAQRRPIGNVGDLAAVIGGMQSNQAIALGALRANLPGEVQVVTKKNLNGQARTIARTAAELSQGRAGPSAARLRCQGHAGGAGRAPWHR